MLWRYSQGVGVAGVQKQQLLSDVRAVRWRLFDAKTGWLDAWPTRKAYGKKTPQALELQISVGRFEQVRRVMLLPEGE